MSIERIVSSKASRALKENAAGLKTRLEHLEAVPSGRVRASRLAELLDTRLRQPPPLRLPPNGTTWQMDQSTAQHINRSELDAWWPEAFIPGNRLELADGLHPPEVIAAWVPNTWTGVADLSSCQSSQLIEQNQTGSARSHRGRQRARNQPGAAACRVAGRLRVAGQGANKLCKRAPGPWPRTSQRQAGSGRRSKCEA